MSAVRRVGNEKGGENYRQRERARERERRDGKGKQIVARRNRFIARDIFQDFFELSQPATAESKLALCPRKIYFIRQ